MCFFSSKTSCFGIWIKYLSKALLFNLSTNSRLKASYSFLYIPASGSVRHHLNLKKLSRDTTKHVSESSSAVTWVGWRAWSDCSARDISELVTEFLLVETSQESCSTVINKDELLKNLSFSDSFYFFFFCLISCGLKNNM